MGLTKIQELEILSGRVKPASVDLLTLGHQVAMAQGISFNQTYKSFARKDSAENLINEHAAAYVGKMMGVSRQVFQLKPEMIRSLQKIIVSLIGSSSATWGQVQNANDAGWESFLENNMWVTFELLAGVTLEEKNEYDTL